MTPFEKRIAGFEVLSKGERIPSYLAASHRIPSVLFSRLQTVVLLYVSRSLVPTEDDWLAKLDRDYWIIRQLDAQRDSIQTITPGGIVVPKRNSVLEYNLVVRVIAEIAEVLGIGDLIGSWHVPPNVRVKFAEMAPGHMDRVRPSERPHSDAWAGEHPESITVHIPVFGDTSNNYVQLYEPPDNFDESWLEPCQSLDPQDILEYETKHFPEYRKVGSVTAKGDILFIDNAMLHATARHRLCGTRISVEVPFLWKTATERPDCWRAGEHAPHEVLLNAGEKYLFYFPDAPEQRVDSNNASKHPSNMRLIDLDLFRSVTSGIISASFIENTGVQ